jgi:hypothetical protein
MMKKILLGVAASVLCMAAHAEERNALMDFLHGTYNGGGFGPGFGPTNLCGQGVVTCDQPTSDTFKLYGGLRLTDYLGSEIGWINFGAAKGLTAPNSLGRPSEYSTRTNGFVINVAPSWALNRSTSIIGRFGFARMHTERTVINNNAVVSGGTETHTSPYFGIALNYSLRDHVPEFAAPLLAGLSAQVGLDATKAKYGNEQGWVRLLSFGTMLEF